VYIVVIFGGHSLARTGTGDHAICSHVCLLWHYLIPFLSHCHLFYNLFSNYVPFSRPGHVDLSGHVVCGSSHSPQVLPVLSVTDFDSVYGGDSDINVNSDSFFYVKFDFKLPITSPLVHSDSDLCNAFDSCDVRLHDYLLDVCNNNKFPDYCNDSEIGSKFSEFVHNVTSLYPNMISHLYTCSVISCSLCDLIKPLSIPVPHSSIIFFLIAEYRFLPALHIAVLLLLSLLFLLIFLFNLCILVFLTSSVRLPLWPLI
jgi:hypothetical protein